MHKFIFHRAELSRTQDWVSKSWFITLWWWNTPCERMFHTYNGSSGSTQLTSFLAVTLLPKVSSAEHQHVHFWDFQHWIGLNRSLQVQAGFQLKVWCSRCWAVQDTGGSVGPVCCLCMCVCVKGALVKYGNSWGSELMTYRIQQLIRSLF